jgi:hypothetical protein
VLNPDTNAVEFSEAIVSTELLELEDTASFEEDVTAPTDRV